MKQNTSIKIYCDRGVEQKTLPALIHELSNWITSYISAKEILHSDWESETSLLIIPGGRDVPFHEALKGEGNQRIRKYVENGGSFLGICAGAYYGCKSVEFDCGMELEVKGLRELNFFPGIARGPVYGPGTFRYRSEYGAKAASISNSFEKGSLKSYYNGGCYFVDADQYANVTCISKYLDIENQPAAIIEITVGQGRVILSGVHIEIGTSYQSTTFKKDMMNMLAPYEEQRKSLFQSIIHHLISVVTVPT